MMFGETWDLARVSDDELLKGLHASAAGERRSMARVIAHLAEVDERRLHLRAGNSSLFDYCVRRLGLSEGSAFRRVTAARLARQFPAVFELLSSGDLHLCGLCALREHLTEANHRELLAEASRKSKREVEELVARRFPRPDVVPGLRKLPARVQDRAAPASPATPAHRAAGEETETRTAPTETQTAPTETQTPPTETQTPPTETQTARADSSRSPARAVPPAPLPNRALVEPLREDRYRLQLNASAELKRKLELARDLMSHANPTGDLAVVVERALELLIDELQRERLGRADRPRTKEGAIDQRRVSNEVRRQVIARDGLRCSFVSDDGVRCSARQFLEFHHEQPWAKGGASDATNVRLLCRAHNQLLAERDFGREHVQQAVARSRARTRDRPQPLRSEQTPRPASSSDTEP